MLPKSVEVDPDRLLPADSRPQARSGREGLRATAAAAAHLLEEGDQAHAGIATDARDLLLTDIEPDPTQPRRHFDATELAALAEDIARRGVLQPILVRPPMQEGQPYRLIAGERRWRAAALAGKNRIPARIRPLSDEDVQAAQLAENILRADLSDIEKGMALRRLYEVRKQQNYKTTWEDIAGEVGLGKSRIHDLFHLANLPEQIGSLITSGQLSGSHGILLQRARETLSEADIIALAEQAARPEGRRTGGYALSVAQLRQQIQQGVVPTTGVVGVTTPTPPETATTVGTGADSMELRPLVQEVVQALQEGRLSAEERACLRQALQASSP